GLADPLPDVLGQLTQVVVARPDLDPRVRNPDQRAAQVVIGEADRLQHGPGGGAMRPSHQQVTALACLRWRLPLIVHAAGISGPGGPCLFKKSRTGSPVIAKGCLFRNAIMIESESLMLMVARGRPAVGAWPGSSSWPAG